MKKGESVELKESAEHSKPRSMSLLQQILAILPTESLELEPLKNSQTQMTIQYSRNKDGYSQLL